MESFMFEPARKSSAYSRRLFIIVNTFNPGHPGTLVVAEAEPTGKAVKAIDRI